MKQSIRKIITAAAVLFAAGFTTSANAQQITVITVVADAKAYRYVKLSGVVVRQEVTLSGVGFLEKVTYNVSETLIDIANTAVNSNRISLDLYRANPRDGDIGIPANSALEGGLPTFGNPPEVIKAGDLFGIFNSRTGDLFSGPWRVYSRASDGALGLAIDNPVLIPRTSSGDFFLNNSWQEIPDSEITAAMGFTPVQCFQGEIAYDQVNCRPIESGGVSHDAGLVLGGVVIVGGLAYLLSDGGETGEFSFSHDFGYSATESGYSANVGGRMDFHKNNWHLYYSGGQTNRNGNFGDFQYESGGKYTADFWTATFSESVSGKTADYDLSLSAKLTGGVWNISPVYRLHSEYEKGETETRNSLNLQSEFRYNRWTIRPAAGFQWRSFGDFANNGKLQINAIHRF